MLPTARHGTGSNDPPELSEDTTLYIISPNTLQAQLLKSCLDNELGLPSFICKSISTQDLMECSIGRPCIYLIDCLNYKDRDVENQFNKTIPAAEVPDSFLIALYNIEADCRIAQVAKQYKIRGLFFREDSQSIFIKGMKAILNGELWLSRKLLSECIMMPDEALNTSHSTELSQLSRREIEILRHVHKGESNQEIADVFGLSLHTVKTHLYNIYKKINVSNRLQATLWATSYLPDEIEEN